MKKMKKSIVFYFVIVLLFVITGCQKSVDKQIIGKWKVTEYNVANIDELAKMMVEKMGYSEDMQAQFKKNIESDYKETFDKAEIVFDDSTMTMNDIVYKWKYLEKESKFTLKSDDGSESELEVNQLKDGVLIADWVIKNPDKNAIISLVMEKQK